MRKKGKKSKKQQVPVVMHVTDVNRITIRHRPARVLTPSQQAKLERIREAEKAGRDRFNSRERGILFDRELVYPLNYYGQ